MGLHEQAAHLFSALLRHLQRRGRFAVFFFTLFTILLSGVHLTFFSYLLDSTEASGPDLIPPPERIATISVPASARETLRTVEGRIDAGTGLAVNLRKKGIPPGEIEELLDSLSPALDFRRLRPGDRFALGIDPEGVLRKLTYRTGPLEAVVADRTGEGWDVERVSLPHETRVETITGDIESSLFESLERLGEKDRLTMDFIDIFAWDIDFAHELQKGDTFRIVVEKIYRDGTFLTYGRVLAAQYRDSEELHEAYLFPFPAGGGDYYTPSGRAVRKTFLKSPVSYSRISSGYSHRRLHPVLKKMRPHLGVDYAAPAGTPVWAPADGTVVSMEYDRSNGKKLVLRHPNGYTSYYLHLSRYGKGIKRGKSVRQKDVIGYVGSTGLSTGPHLDYRLKRGGKWINPLREKFPLGKPLPEEYSTQFAQYREWLSGALATPFDRFFADASETAEK